jgi:hypothetical protein
MRQSVSEVTSENLAVNWFYQGPLHRRLHVVGYVMADRFSPFMPHLYILEGELDRGGCATVYKAVHVGTGAEVAFKVSSVADCPDYAVTEWLSLQKLSFECPSTIGIPDTLEFGVFKSADGAPSTWMSLQILGPSLDVLLRRGQIRKESFLQVKVFK